jgi:hypothetical protein
MKALMAIMLISGLYTDAQLYGAKRRDRAQCARLGGYCGRDLGYLDRDGRFHPAARKTEAWPR